MLTVLYGPPCIGKTTIQHILVADHGFKPIRCFSTRPPRNHDLGRVQVTPASFEEMKDKGKFFIVNTQFGFLYGTSKDDLENAMQTTDQYVLDFRIQDYLQLSSIHHRPILVTVKNEVQLKLQIKNAKREDREHLILDEYRQFYSHEQIEKFKLRHFYILFNQYNALHLTIKELIQQYKGQ